VTATNDATAGPDLPEIEERLRQLWAEVLPHYEARGGEDFFMLGGTSIHAVRVASRLSKFLGVRISAGEFFFHSTVEELAEIAWKALGE
jgi:hypothetical protein